jgi:hypothetical protein
VTDISLTKLLPLLSKFGTYVKVGADHYADLKGSGMAHSPEVIALFLQAKMVSWSPEISGRPILDDETKAAAARMIAGIVTNLSQA